jgi:tRNA uridine 5-carboxymethylaminomethyl modification enzyme
MSTTQGVNFDAVVVGGGHAGIEAVRALSSQGLSVALVTLDPHKIGAMSCNPAIGGVAKSHLVSEIDALGGWMGAGADRNGIQARRLNLTKGPAVRSTRIQCDKDRYAATMQAWMTELVNVSVVKGEGAVLLHDSARITGIELGDGTRLNARSVVITAGTFMRGLMFCGETREKGGRFGDSAADKLTASILSLGHQVKRLKTGTPARLKASSIDFSLFEKQWGDPEQRKFSWRELSAKLPQLCCYFGYTNEETHEVIRKNFHRSPLFSGDIQGVGPRYCPSVEDKIRRFADRERHQIFLEPEGLDSDSIYPNGLSTSLPSDVQLDFLRTIRGLEKVELLRPGYAVEYDTINPTELLPSFQSRFLEGLFFAGQVNRTSGYEEAAAQGLWAGINAGLYTEEKPTLLPDRSRSYLETLVDDLVTKGTDEPYRMFTSRSEYRLLLREDNAHDRLHELGSKLGLLSEGQKSWYDAVLKESAKLKNRLGELKLRVNEDRVISLFEYLKRPEVCWEQLAAELPEGFTDLAIERAEIEAKYSGYLLRQESELRELREVQAWRLDLSSCDLSQVSGLSSEVREKLKAAQPQTVAELAALSGVTPAAVLAISRVAGVRKLEFVSRETSA